MKAEFKIEKESAKTTLIAKGDLVVQSSAALKEHLLQLLSETKETELHFEGVSAVDVSAIQLVRTFQRELKSNGRKIQFLPPTNCDLIELLTKTGLIGFIQSEN